MATRADLIRIVEMRQGDAVTLFAARRYPGAYYISGLAVECGIKVIIAGQFRRNEIPQKGLVEKIYSHDLEQLIVLAGLKIELKDELDNNEGFYVNWNVVKDWNINCRYNPHVRKFTARDMLNAISDETNGVIPWLQRHW